MNEQKLRKTFTDVLGVPDDQITDVLGPYAVPAWDSIGQMALVAELERVFERTLEVNDIVDLNSAGKAREIMTRLGVTFP